MSTAPATDLEYKAGPAEYKALGDKGEYEGYFSITGNIDDGLDIIERGAFAKTLAERRGRILPMYMHDWKKLLGPPPDVIEEDAKGLYIKGRLTLGSFWSREMVWPLLVDGALKEGSIGFSTIAGKVDYEPNNVRRIREVRLYEYSFVALGMNPDTQIDALKALRRAGVDEKTIYSYLLAELKAMHLKAGSRHSRADIDMLDAIHEMVVKLGCTNCAPPEIASGTDEAAGEKDATPTDAPIEIITPDPAAARAVHATLSRQLKTRAADLALATASHNRRTP